MEAVYSTLNNLSNSDSIQLIRKLKRLFFLSGMAALIYQIVWFRVLYTWLGTNIESVTIIVSIFMFGLGIGSLTGGLLSVRYSSRLPDLFALLEGIIGLFGVVSIPLIKIVGHAVAPFSYLAMPIALYLLLCIPTIAMGASLPILIAYVHQHEVSIGDAVAGLYAINTLGSALACFLTIIILFLFLGLQQIVFFAAVINFFVGITVWCTKFPQFQDYS